MTVRTLADYILLFFTLLVAFSLIAGSLLGQPILLSYVETGSMSPTMESGDGFVAIPAELAGHINEDDVIVFNAKEIQGGGLTTHRVVDETDRGFVTKGDANPFIDQDGDEPPVKKAQVVAVAWQPGGGVLVIPHLGTVVEGTQSVLSTLQRRLATTLGTSALLGPQGLAYLLFAGTVLWYAVGMRRDNNSKRRDCVTSRMTGVDTRLVVGVFAAMLVLGATAAMAVPAGTQEYGIVSAEFTSDRPNVIQMGESKSQRYAVGNGGLFPIVTYLEPASEGVEVQPQNLYVERRSVANATVMLHAPPETGYYRRYVAEHRYLAVPPQSVIRGLYEFHPWAPIVVIDAMIVVPFYLIGVRLIGRARIRRERSRESSESIVTRVRGFVTDLY
jgi:signal peptidase